MGRRPAGKAASSRKGHGEGVSKALALAGLLAAALLLGALLLHSPWAPVEQEHGSRTVLSTSPHLEVWDGFLSPDEVAAASALQFTRGEMNSTRNTRVITYYDALDAIEVPLLAAIDRRVAEWTGLASIDHTGMQAKHQLGQPSDASNTGGEQVHLDNNNNPFRFATVILYLSDVPDSARGATVFPCLLPPLPDGATMSQHAAHRRETTKRAKLCRKATKQVQAARGWALSQNKEDDPHGLWAMSAGICNGTLEGLKVQPRSGRGIMFKTGQFSVTPDGRVQPGSADPLLWHTACELLGGATKRIMIKFQEVDPDTRAMLVRNMGGVSVPEPIRRVSVAASGSIRAELYPILIAVESVVSWFVLGLFGARKPTKIIDLRVTDVQSCR
jgi:hypothetical protein